MPTALPLARPLVFLSIVLQSVVAGLFVMMASGKLTGSADARFLFEQMGMEPTGRYATGGAELIAAVLLFVPRARWAGALLAMGVAAGAIGSHLTKLGLSPSLPSTITPETPGGVADPSLFFMALGVFLASGTVLAIRRAELPVIGAKLAGSPASDAA